MWVKFQTLFTGLLTIGRVLCGSENGTFLPVESGFGCGARLSSGFILGGENAKKGEFPFIATLGYTSDAGPNGIAYACGGALINRRYVLTAAHCHAKNQPIAEVVLGEHNFDQDPDCIGCPKVQRFNISEDDVTKHPGFRPREVVKNGDDLALIRLPTLAITIDQDPAQNVMPVCLAWNKSIKLPNKENVVMGWGRTNNDQDDSGNQTRSGAFSSILQKLIVKEIPYAECKESPLFKDISATKHICAGGEQGKDSCSGDSGGPLIVRNSADGSMYLKGIVSFGTKKCGKGVPGVYINVSYYMPWIIENLKP